MRTHTVIALFDKAPQARTAVQELINNGYDRKHIDIAAQATDTNRNSTTGRPQDDSAGSGISNFFGSLFDDDNTRKAYTELGRRSSVVTVHADSESSARKAATILDKYEASNVKDRAEKFRKAGVSIPVIDEKMNVGKREVETDGSVRLKSRIIERPVEESIRLRSEHVHVERDRVNRPATEADFKNFEEGTFTLKEHKEVPVVEKDARVVEEVSISKDVNQRVEKVRDKVRRTKVEVEKVGADDEAGNRRRR